MYTTPGNYSITVTVSDGSGTSVEKPILVLGTANLCTNLNYHSVVISDSISRVTISTPRYVVVDIAATFTARVELTFNSAYSSPVTYQWSYDGGNNSGPLHVFHEAGMHNITCIATNFVSQSSSTISVDVQNGTFIYTASILFISCA